MLLTHFLKVDGQIHNYKVQFWARFRWSSMFTAEPQRRYENWICMQGPCRDIYQTKQLAHCRNFASKRSKFRPSASVPCVQTSHKQKQPWNTQRNIANVETGTLFRSHLCMCVLHRFDISAQTLYHNKEQKATHVVVSLCVKFASQTVLLISCRKPESASCQRPTVTLNHNHHLTQTKSFIFLTVPTPFPSPYFICCNHKLPLTLTCHSYHAQIEEF